MGQQEIPGLVSIMIPTYERPTMFEETLKSALNQTYPHVEIIVNDNSRDENTAKLMEKYSGIPRLRYFRNREAKTKAENFRPFERLARGEYLQWLMDDDILRPDKLRLMTGVLKHNPQVKLVGSIRGVIDAEGKYLGQRSTELNFSEECAIIKGRDLGRFMLRQFRNSIGEPSAVLFRRRELKSHYWGAEAKGYLTISDVAMWLELMEQGDVAMFRDPLSDYRFHPDQEGRQGNVILLSRLEWLRLGTEYFSRRVFLETAEDYLALLKKLVAEYEVEQRDAFANLSPCPLWPEYLSAVDTMKNILALEPTKLEEIFPGALP